MDLCVKMDLWEELAASQNRFTTDVDDKKSAVNDNDLLAASLADAGIIKTKEDNMWLDDMNADDLLDSLLTGSDQIMLDDDHLLHPKEEQPGSPDGVKGQQRDLLFHDDGHHHHQLLLSSMDSSSASSTVSCSTDLQDDLHQTFGKENSASDPASGIDLIRFITNDSFDDDDAAMQGLDPITNAPSDDLECLEDSRDKEEVIVQEACQQPKVGLPRRRVIIATAAKNGTSTAILRNSTAATQQLLRPLAADIAVTSPVSQSTSTGNRFSLASPISGMVKAGVEVIPSSSSSSATATFYLPVIHSTRTQQPTIIRNGPSLTSGPPNNVLANPVQRHGSKRRRVSASSSDSGLDDCASTTTTTTNSSSSSPVMGEGRSGLELGPNKYPRLELNDEEKKLCKKEGIILPSHYPLTKEEERNLKRIRRKIRNKLSAQDSRKRKKEYVDSMEARAMRCVAENAELQKKISMLENQNRTLVGQLKRLHQIIVNKGGLSSSSSSSSPVVAPAAKGQQTSTALMVLLLSSALFLIPGMRDQYEAKINSSSSDRGDTSKIVSQAIKAPPLPGQSRSLLQFSLPPSTSSSAGADTCCAAVGGNGGGADVNGMSGEPAALMGCRNNLRGLQGVVMSPESQGPCVGGALEATSNSKIFNKNMVALNDHDYYATVKNPHGPDEYTAANYDNDSEDDDDDDDGLLQQGKSNKESLIILRRPNNTSSQHQGYDSEEKFTTVVDDYEVVVSTSAILKNNNINNPSKILVEDYNSNYLKQATAGKTHVVKVDDDANSDVNIFGNSFVESVRRLNVSVTGRDNATRTVVLHVPKGIR